MSENRPSDLSLSDSACRGRTSETVIVFAQNSNQVPVPQMVAIFLTAMKCDAFTCPFARARDGGFLKSMEMIRVPDMLSEMLKRDEKGEFVPFEIEFVTCNLKNNTGGEKIRLDRAVFYGGPSERSTRRNPNHADHFTRNIRHQDSDRIIKIHPLLVTRFNGKQVCQ